MSMGFVIGVIIGALGFDRWLSRRINKTFLNVNVTLGGDKSTYKRYGNMLEYVYLLCDLVEKQTYRAGLTKPVETETLEKPGIYL
jgi:hypothetical protein